MRQIRSITNKELWPFITEEPLLAHFFIRSKVFEDNSASHIASVRVINGQIFLTLNPGLMKILPREQKIGILVHEYLHVLLLHCTSRIKHNSSSKRHKENAAMDMAINQLIVKRWSLPEGVIYHNSPSFNFPPGLSAERYFTLLDSKFTDEEFTSLIFSELDAHDDWISSSPSDSIVIKQIVKDYIERSSSKSIGSTVMGLGSSPHDILQKLIIPVVDDDIGLGDFINSILKKTVSDRRRRTYRRLSRRYGWPHAGTTNSYTSRLAFVADVSGSMSDHFIQYAIGHLNKLSLFSKVDLIECDENIKATIKDYRAKDLLDIKGRGSTNLKPAFDLANKNKYDAVVCCTDGHMKAIPSSKIPTFWLCFDNEDFSPEYGEVFYINFER